jgi:FkbM family methyltransferase
MIDEIKRLLGIDPNFRPQLCYGQDGEDLIADRLLGRRQTGFYVDVGAHHPVRFSNTYLFYRRGWRGINIDAEPGSMQMFERYRPRDLNIECGVGSHAGKLPYFRFNETALNTVSEAEAALKDRPPYKLVARIEIVVRRLDEILDEFLPAGQNIDFMSIDVEGTDAAVLSSNDWARFRPELVLVETLRTDVLSLGQCPSSRLLLDAGYRPVAKSYNTAFFQRDAD